MPRLISAVACNLVLALLMSLRCTPLLLLASSGLFADSVTGHLVRSQPYRQPARNAPEVVIYYAAETAPDGPAAENSRQVAAWLTALNNQEAQKESKAILSDLVLFPAVVRGDIAALSGAAASHHMLIFSNEMARAGVYLLGISGRPLVRVPFSCVVSESPDPIRAASPLSSPECLAAALKEAATRFPVAQYSFTVLLNGHGYSERTLVPRICVRDTEISKEWLAQVFAGQAGDSARQYRSRYGMSKPGLLQVLGTTVPGMNLSLVLLHSCHSAPAPQTEIPKNIGVLWTYDDSVKYDSIDYASVLGAAVSGTVSAAMDAYLLHSQRDAARALLYQQARAIAVKLIWFVPLALYGFWSLWNSSRASGRPSTAAA